MVDKSFIVRRINIAIVGLILSLLYVLPALGQPTTLREFPPAGRRQLTQNRLTQIGEITDQIKRDNSNAALYQKRSELYGELLQLNFDNKDWFTYADQFEKDLSRLIELEKKSEAYYRRGGWLSTRLLYSEPLYPYPPPNKISELYPHNRYVDRAAADFLKALRLTADPRQIQSIYTNLSIIYSARPQKLVSAADFPKWKDKLPLGLIQKDFEMSIKYSQLALQAGASLAPGSIAVLRKNLAATYLVNAEIAAKLGDRAAALKFTRAAQNYRE